MFGPVALRALNHLLAAEDWARRRLYPFAGKTARIESGPWRLDLEITADGLFATPGGDSAPAVLVRLPADAPWRAAFDPASLAAAIRLEGAADFAETLGFIFRHLRWDAEHDLAERVGDIAAHRLAGLARRIIDGQRHIAARVKSDLSARLGENASLSARRQELARFAADLHETSAALDRLERRVAAAGG